MGLFPVRSFSQETPVNRCVTQLRNVLPGRDAWNLFLGSHPESKVLRDGLIGLNRGEAIEFREVIGEGECELGNSGAGWGA